MAGFGSVTFKELHLFPRTLFAIGAALFISSLISPKCHLAGLVLGLGLSLIFFAVGFNILYDLVRSHDQVCEKKDKESDAAATANGSSSRIPDLRKAGKIAGSHQPDYA
jgi:hypothetical protein